MTEWKKSLRSAHFDREIDRALEARAKEEGVGKGLLIVEYIEEGLCIPGAIVPSEGPGETPALPSQGAPKVMRSFYINSALAGTLSSRASGEGVTSSRLIERFCAEGLARPPTGGRLLRKTQERFVAEQKAKIEELTRAAREAIKAVRDAEAEFMERCPHLRRVSDLPIATCQDCGSIVARSS